MKFLNLHTLFFCFFLFINGGIFSQNDIAQLDSMAFVALESHSPKTEELAKQILLKTKEDYRSKHTINAYTILGIINKDKGYYVSSLNYYLKALNAAEKKKDEGRISSSLNNIGIIYQLQRNFQSAITYFSNSLKLEEKFNNPLQKSIRYYNIGDCYKELDSFDLALSYFNNSLLIEQKHKNSEGIIYAYLGIAEVYLEIDQADNAKMILDKIKVNLKDTYIEGSIFYHKLLGTYYYKKNNMNEALSIFQLAQTISEKRNFPIHLVEIFKYQISVYEKLNDVQSLAKKYKELTTLNDKLGAIEIRNKIHDLTYSNEIQKKDREIALIEGERNFAEKLNVYNKKITGFLILVVVFIVGIVIYGLQKRNKWEEI